MFDSLVLIAKLRKKVGKCKFFSIKQFNNSTTLVNKKGLRNEVLFFVGTIGVEPMTLCL